MYRKVLTDTTIVASQFKLGRVAQVPRLLLLSRSGPDQSISSKSNVLVLHVRAMMGPSSSWHLVHGVVLLIPGH